MHAKLIRPISARANRMKTSLWLSSTISPFLLLSTTRVRWKNCLPTKSTLTSILSSASSTPCASPAIFSSAVRAKPSNSFPATTRPIMPAYRRFKAEKNAMPSPSVSNWKAAISSLLPKHNTPACKPCWPPFPNIIRFRPLPVIRTSRRTEKPIPGISSIGHAFKKQVFPSGADNFQTAWTLIGRHNAVTTVYFRYNSAIHSDA